MIYGWLVVNAFLKTPKFEELYSRLIRAFIEHGVSLVKKSNADLLSVLNQPIDDPPDFVLFWDKDIPLAIHLENCGLRLFNSARSVAYCDDKGLTALALEGSGIPVPKTIISPMKFSGTSFSSDSFLDTAGEQLGYPLILKERNGSFGAQVHLINNCEELHQVFYSVPEANWIFQEYIVSSFGRDLRVQTLGGRIAAAVTRFGAEGDFRSNVTAGGRMEPVKLPQSFADAALAAAQKLQLDFAGVDILYGPDEEPIICEINSNAHFVNLDNTLGISFADMLAEEIIRKIGL